ncbi:MAG: HAMP domain-containing histidine kinase [Chitinophagaceae bacterium]|nr:MAG: HAMP domain-containing histidine kinase [Chitinophagaceae bacterium]
MRSNASDTVATILHHMPQVLFSLHWETGKFLYLGPGYETIWERPSPASDHGEEEPKKEFFFQDWLEHFVAEDRSQVAGFLEELRVDQRQRLECRITLPGNGIKWVLLMAIKKKAAHGHEIFGTVEDITAQEESRSVMQHFADRKNTLLQLLSHDLLGPLSTIQLSAGLLAGPEPLDEQDAAEILGLIALNCTRSVHLIQNLVNDEFLTSSESQLLKQRVELVAKMKLIVSEFRDSPNGHSHLFDFNCSAETLFVNIDEAKFTQVIINLLSNAQKFTPAGGSIELRLDQKDGRILLEVKDSGIGIPDSIKPFLFEKFTRARRVGLRGEPTIGLGMSIIKTIVEWHEGSIDIQSREGEGTTVSIVLPLITTQNEG